MCLSFLLVFFPSFFHTFQALHIEPENKQYLLEQLSRNTQQEDKNEKEEGSSSSSSSESESQLLSRPTTTTSPTVVPPTASNTAPCSLLDEIWTYMIPFVGLYDGGATKLACLSRHHQDLLYNHPTIWKRRFQIATPTEAALMLHVHGKRVRDVDSACTSKIPLSDADVIHCANLCPLLERLHIVKSTDMPIKCLSRCCPSLKILHIFDSSELTDAAVESIALNCSRMEELRLYHASKLTDRSLVALADNLPGFQYLLVQNCPQITDAGVIEL